MSWITVDTKLDDHPKMAALPSDTARWGWIVTLCKAKEQRTPGTFASEKHYRYVMGRRGRFLKDYIAAKLLDKAEDGTLAVHDWRKHQWAGAKAQQREDIPRTSEGQTEDIPETNLGPEEDASRAVPVPVYVSSSNGEGVQGEPDAVDAFYRRTSEVPGPKIRSWLNDLGEAHGERRLASMIDDTPSSGMKVPDYLKAVQNRLRLDDIAAERQEKRDEERRLEEKRRPIPIRPVEEPEISAEEADRIAREYMAQAKAMQ